MQKSLKLKKFCLSCNNLQYVKLETNKIKDNIKCPVYRCLTCGFVFLDKSFLREPLAKYKFYYHI